MTNNKSWQNVATENKSSWDGDSQESCEFCCDPSTRFTSELSTSIQGVSHLKEFLNMSIGLGKKELEFLTIDVRVEREQDDGMIPRSQVIDFKNAREDMISKLIDELIELRNDYHFCFMIDSFESANVRSSRPNQNGTFNSCHTID